MRTRRHDASCGRHGRLDGPTPAAFRIQAMTPTEQRDAKVEELLRPICALNDFPLSLRLTMRAHLLAAWEDGNKRGNRDGADYATQTVATVTRGDGDGSCI